MVGLLSFKSIIKLFTFWKGHIILVISSNSYNRPFYNGYSRSWNDPHFYLSPLSSISASIYSNLAIEGSDRRVSDFYLCVISFFLEVRYLYRRWLMAIDAADRAANLAIVDKLLEVSVISS